MWCCVCCDSNLLRARIIHRAEGDSRVIVSRPSPSNNRSMCTTSHPPAGVQPSLDDFCLQGPVGYSVSVLITLSMAPAGSWSQNRKSKSPGQQWQASVTLCKRDQSGSGMQLSVTHRVTLTLSSSVQTRPTRPNTRPEPTVSHTNCEGLGAVTIRLTSQSPDIMGDPGNLGCNPFIQRC